VLYQLVPAVIFGSPVGTYDQYTYIEYGIASLLHFVRPGRRVSSEPVEVVVTLRFNHPDELEQLVSEQSNRASSNYHRYLTSAEFAERFGPTADQVDRVISELRKAGFQPTETSTNRLLVHAAAPAAVVENYFRTEIHTVDQGADGIRHMNVKPALLPDALVPLVKAVHVDNLVVAKVGAYPTGPLKGPDGGYTPVALANSLAKSGVLGVAGVVRAWFYQDRPCPQINA